MKRFVMLAAACVIAVPAFAQNVATVNGKPITPSSVDQFVKLLITQGATDSEQLREQVKQEIDQPPGFPASRRQSRYSQASRRSNRT